MCIKSKKKLLNPCYIIYTLVFCVETICFGIDAASFLYLPTCNLIPFKQWVNYLVHQASLFYNKILLGLEWILRLIDRYRQIIIIFKSLRNSPQLADYYIAIATIRKGQILSRISRYEC